MSGLGSLGHRLYSGEVSYDFVGRKKTWYIVSAVIIVVAVGAILLRGLNLGIEFRGGADFSLPNATCSIEQARVTAEIRHGRAGDRHGDGQWDDPRPDRVADAGGELGPGRPAGRYLRDPEGRGQGPGGRADLGRGDLQEGAAGPGRLPAARLDLPVDLLRVADGRRGPRRPGTRPPDHGGHLRPHRPGGDARHGHRTADDPRLLAVRHGRGVRQGQGEHARNRRPVGDDLRRRGEPRGEPDSGSVDQHVDRRAPARPGHHHRRSGLPRCGHASRPRGRAVHRHGGRHLLVDLHRDALPGAAQGEPARDEGPGRSRRGSSQAGEVGARLRARTRRSR